MDTPAGYINLDRRFRISDGSARSEELAAQSYLAGSLGHTGDLGWDDLHKQKLVVILGEPGSGKSWEFRRRCATQQSRGDFAFLIELERLVSGSFSELLSPLDHARFREWHKSELPALFLLDSVDAAKIRQQSDFYRALDKVRDVIGQTALERAHVVISSRISEWQPETDRYEVA